MAGVSTGMGEKGVQVGVHDSLRVRRRIINVDPGHPSHRRHANARSNPGK